MGKQSREKWLRRSSGQQNVEARKQDFQTGLEKACLFIIRWGTYATLFTPLIVATDFFFPFVAPKSTFFRIMVEIIFASYLILLFANNKYRPRINPLTIAVTAFLGIFILASFTGVNLDRSFWSTYERMTGIWTMLHLYAFFMVLANCFRKKDDWQKFLGASVLVGVFLSLYIIRGDELSTRGGGTIGNTSFMAAYLLFDVFFAAILLFSNFLKRGNAPLFWQIFAGVSMLIMMPVFLTSSARMAIGAFLGGLLLMGLGYMVLSQRKILKRSALTVISVLIISAAVLAVSQPSFLKQEMTDTIRDMQARFVVWTAGWKGFLERPILGWGPENFNVVFTRYFNPCMFSYCGGEIWFDRTHNIIFDTLATTGALGLISYLAMFAAALYCLFKVMRKISDKRNFFLYFGVIALLAAYFMQNLLVFDMINTYLVFFLSLAFVVFLSREEQQEKETAEIKTRRVNPFFAVSIILATAVFLWWGNIKPLIAGHYVVKAAAEADINKSVAYFEKSLDSWMNQYETREQFTQRLVRGTSYSADIKESLFKALALTESEMEKSVKENSFDFRPHLFLAQLYNVSYQITQDQQKLALAEKYAEKSIQLSPTNQQGYWYLGEIKLAQGKLDESVGLFKKAVELEPKLAKSHWYLAMVYKFAQQPQLAREEIMEAEKRGLKWKDDISSLRGAIAVYESLNDDRALLELYQRAVELDPSDAQTQASLAAAYANLGQFDKAREVAETIRKNKPEMSSQVDNFLRTLPK